MFSKIGHFLKPPAATRDTMPGEAVARVHEDQEKKQRKEDSTGEKPEPEVVTEEDTLDISVAALRAYMIEQNVENLDAVLMDLDALADKGVSTIMLRQGDDFTAVVRRLAATYLT